MNCYARQSKAVLRRPVDSGQYTPVDSIATVVMPTETSQLALASMSAVKLSNVRTGSSLSSGGTAATWVRAPMSISG